MFPEMRGISAESMLCPFLMMPGIAFIRRLVPEDGGIEGEAAYAGPRDEIVSGEYYLFFSLTHRIFQQLNCQPIELC